MVPVQFEEEIPKHSRVQTSWGKRYGERKVGNCHVSAEGKSNIISCDQKGKQQERDQNHEGEGRRGESSISSLPDGYSPIFRSYVFGPSGFLTMAPLRYAAKFDPFLSLDCAPTPSTLAQSKERKGSKFAIWQPWDGGLSNERRRSVWSR